MRFEWDKAKPRANLEKHSLDFADAPEIFAGEMVIALDRRLDYGEARFIGFGLLKGRVMAIICSRRMPDLIRVISLRKANQGGQRRYEQAVTDRLGQN
jgi:uncharacterized DUF497 family protein